MTRVKLFTGDHSRELEEEINVWLGEMETEHGVCFYLVSVLPFPMNGEMLYAIARYQLLPLPAVGTPR